MIEQAVQVRMVGIGSQGDHQLVLMHDTGMALIAVMVPVVLDEWTGADEAEAVFRPGCSHIGYIGASTTIVAWDQKKARPRFTRPCVTLQPFTISGPALWR
jgi:hypothetical protein